MSEGNNELPDISIRMAKIQNVDITKCQHGYGTIGTLVHCR